MFEPGQLVECVIGGQWNPARFHDRHHTYPVKGRVYTIRNVSTYQFYTGVDDAVWLEELRRNASDEPYGAERFRPIHEERLSIFRKMLEPVERGEIVDA